LYPVESMVANRLNVPDALKHLPRDPESLACNNALQAGRICSLAAGTRHAGRNRAAHTGRYLA